MLTTTASTLRRPLRQPLWKQAHSVRHLSCCARKWVSHAYLGHSFPYNQSSSSLSSTNKATNGDCHPTSAVDSKLSSSEHRRLGRAHSAAAVCFFSRPKVNLSLPAADENSTTRESQRHPAARRSGAGSISHAASGSCSGPITPQVTSTEAPVDPDLLKLCPDLSNDPKNHDRSSAGTRDDKHRNMRSSKPASVPTNPLAARRNTQNLIGPERKKQRLTMGEGGGWAR